MERADGAGARRAQLVLHLHRLDHDQQRAGLDRVARRDQHLRDPAVHRREQLAGGAAPRFRPGRGGGHRRRRSRRRRRATSWRRRRGRRWRGPGGRRSRPRPRRRRRCRGVRRGRRSGAARRRSGRRGRRGCRSASRRAPAPPTTSGTLQATAGDDDQPRQSGDRCSRGSRAAVAAARASSADGAATRRAASSANSRREEIGRRLRRGEARMAQHLGEEGAVGRDAEADGAIERLGQLLDGRGAASAHGRSACRASSRRTG